MAMESRSLLLRHLENHPVQGGGDHLRGEKNHGHPTPAGRMGGTCEPRPSKGQVKLGRYTKTCKDQV